MNKTSHSKILHYPTQQSLHVLARDTKLSCQGLQRLPALDMFPMRHQMKLRKGKSSFEFLSRCNARNKLKRKFIFLYSMTLLSRT